jgi:hypothetical protein
MSTEAGLDRVGVMDSREVYYTKHGPLWRDLDGIVYKLYNYDGPDTARVGKLNRWYSRGYIMAEKIDYEALLLEDLFLP